MEWPTKVGRADAIRVVLSVLSDKRVALIFYAIGTKNGRLSKGMFPPTSQRYTLIAHYKQSEMTSRSSELLRHL